MNSETLIEHFDRISEAPNSEIQIRRLIFDLALRGKLARQDPNDEPAEVLLNRIFREIQCSGKSLSINEEEQTFNIPTGWSWTRLGDISRKIHYGFTASANQSIQDVRLLRITDIQDNTVDWLSVPGCEISEKEIPRYKLERGDILIARTGGTIGKTFLIKQIPVTAVFASYLIRVQLAAGIYDRYLKLFMESSVYWKQLQDGTRGAGQPNVNGQTLGKMLVPVPPLSEQHRIIAKVDELMVLCDQLEAARTEREKSRDRLVGASLQRMDCPTDDKEIFKEHASFTLNQLIRLTTRSAHIKQLRHTILNLAMRGFLSIQNPDDEPASILFSKILFEKNRLKKEKHLPSINEIDYPFPIPSGWKWVRLGQICSKTGSGSTPKGGREAYPSSGVMFLRSQNVYDDGLRLDNIAFITEETHQRMKSTTVLPGDLLLNITGGSIGRCALVPADFSLGNINQHVAIIRLAFNELSAFTHLTIISPYFQNEIIQSQTGAGREGLPKNRMDEIMVPLPPLAEQHRIVTKVHELMKLCDQLERQIDITENNSFRLLEAVLHDTLTSTLKPA